MGSIKGKRGGEDKVNKGTKKGGRIRGIRGGGGRIRGIREEERKQMLRY